MFIFTVRFPGQHRVLLVVLIVISLQICWSLFPNYLFEKIDAYKSSLFVNEIVYNRRSMSYSVLTKKRRILLNFD